jgi:hypothetical protein
MTCCIGLGFFYNLAFQPQQTAPNDFGILHEAGRSPTLACDGAGLGSRNFRISQTRRVKETSSREALSAAKQSFENHMKVKTNVKASGAGGGGGGRY